MKRVAIFASYFKEGIIPEYVIYYLRGLKKVADDIVFIADNEIKSGEEEKLRDLVIYSKCERHGCYDFGSYRRGFEWAEKNGFLVDAAELIFCNDSCYGPIYPFEKVFAEMEKKECDFWGMTEAIDREYHIQSFFMVFKNNVFRSQKFIDFVHSFEKQNTFWDYVEKYETQVRCVLSNVGFRADSFIEISEFENKLHTNPMLCPIETLKKGMPLIKRKIFLSNYDGYYEEPLIELLYRIGEKNEVLFRLIKDDIAGNDILFVEKLCKQNREILKSLLRFKKKAKKRLKTLRLMIYTNIVLSVSVLILLYFYLR